MKKKDKKSQFGFSNEHWELVEKYLREYDTAEKRTQALLQKVQFKGCSYCGTSEVRMNPGGRSAYCSKCRVNSHVTAGTFFHGMSRLDVMHPQFYFLDAGIEFSSNQIKRLFDCAYNTAWEANRRIQKVIVDAMGEILIAIHSSLFSMLYLKRSLETPANQHPRAEQFNFKYDDTDNEATSNSYTKADEADQSSSHADAESTAMNNHATSSQDSEQKTLLTFIGNEGVSFDDILLHESKSISEVCFDLLQLELDGLIEKLPGDRYALKTSKDKLDAQSLQITSIQLIEQTNDQLLEKIEQIVLFLKDIFHGTSRKYLQFFVGTHWFYHDKNFWRKGELLQQCVRHARITIKEIKAFVTPANVSCFLLPAQKMANASLH